MSGQAGSAASQRGFWSRPTDSAMPRAVLAARHALTLAPSAWLAGSRHSSGEEHCHALDRSRSVAIALGLSPGWPAADRRRRSLPPRKPISTRARASSSSSAPASAAGSISNARIVARHLANHIPGQPDDRAEEHAGRRPHPGRELRLQPGAQGRHHDRDLHSGLRDGAGARTQQRASSSTRRISSGSPRPHRATARSTCGTRRA